MPSLVQSASGTGTTGTSITATFGAGTTAANCVVANMGTAKTASATAPTVTGVTLGGAAGNFARAKALAQATGSTAAVNTEIWTDQNCAGAQTAVAMTLSAAPSASFIWAEEWTGLATSGAVDKTNAAGATTGSWSSGSTGVLTQASEVVVACVTCDTGAAITITGPGASWTNLAQLGGGGGSGLLAGWQVVSATTALTYSGTQTATTFEANAAVIVTLLAASSGLSGTLQPVTAAAAPRRPPSRAWIRFTPVRTTNAIPVAGTLQPVTARAAPRRPPSRAWIRFIPVTTTNAQGPPPPALYRTPRPPRRPPSRAWVYFRPVRTTNQPQKRTLLVSIAATTGMIDDYGNVIRGGLTSYDVSGNYTQSAAGVLNMSSGAPSTPAQLFPGGAGQLVASSGQVTAFDPTAQLLLLSAAANGGTAELGLLAPVVQLTNVAPGTIPVGGVSGSLITVPHNPNDPTYGGAGGTTWIAGERLVLDNQIDNINSNFVLIINALKQAGVIT